MTRIAISMGDPAGIGPEITVRALQAAALDASAITVYGSARVFAELEAQLGLTLPAGTTLRDCDDELPAEPSAGARQVRALERAVDAVLAGEADALCTAPITKSAAAAAGFAFPGHTEYLAQRGGASEHAMMLAGPWLRVVPLTGHVPLAGAPAALAEVDIAATLLLIVRALQQDFAVARPRVVITGLNPHAGEDGMLGDEEQRVMTPQIAAAREQLSRSGVGAELVGPLPADAFFARVREDGCHAVVTCTHDQGLIPFKMVHRDDGVNVTLGLPFVRTSPAHGSARDIAGRGVARPESMVAALQMAAAIARRRLLHCSKSATRTAAAPADRQPR